MPAPKDPVAYALWKERMSKARTGEKNPMFGTHLKEETKQKISKTRIELGLSKGENNPFYGKKHSDETLDVLRKPKSDEHKQHISEAMQGREAWNKGLPSPWTKGIPRTEETKKKISESNKGKNSGKPSWNKGIPFSEESKQKMSDAKLGKQNVRRF